MFNIDLNTVYLIIEIIGGAITIFGVIKTFIKKVYNPVKKFVEDIKRVHKNIDLIVAEIQPNHGSSIKDKIDSIELQQKKLAEKLSDNTKLTVKVLDRQDWMLNNEEKIVLECDLNGNCIWVNQKCCEWLKRDNNYFLGNGWKNAIYIDDRSKMTEEWAKSIMEKRDSENILKMMDKDGQIYKVKFNSTKSNNTQNFMILIQILDDFKSFESE